MKKEKNKIDHRKLAKHIMEKAEKEGINVCQRDEQKMDKTIRDLLRNVKYDEHEQQMMLNKKDWKGKLRTYMLIAGGLATGAIVIAASSTEQAIAGTHN